MPTVVITAGARYQAKSNSGFRIAGVAAVVAVAVVVMVTRECAGIHVFIFC